MDIFEAEAARRFVAAVEKIANALDRKTEPQTDNGIGCSKCESRFWCMDRDMPHAVHCNNYGKTEQTERSEQCT